MLKGYTLADLKKANKKRGFFNFQRDSRDDQQRYPQVTRLLAGGFYVQADRVHKPTLYQVFMGDARTGRVSAALFEGTDLQEAKNFIKALQKGKYLVVYREKTVLVDLGNEGPEVPLQAIYTLAFRIATGTFKKPERAIYHNTTWPYWEVLGEGYLPAQSHTMRDVHEWLRDHEFIINAYRR